MQLIGFDLAELAQKGMKLGETQAAEFKECFQSIAGTLRTMGMEEKANEIEAGVGNKVRSKIMEKFCEILPAQLAEEGVKATVRIPEWSGAAAPALEEPKPVENALALDTPFVLSAHIDDRNALLDDMIEKKIGHRIQKFVASHVPEEKFNAKVAEKLEGEVPKALEEAAGIKVLCERMPESAHAIVVRFSIKGFDLSRLLTMAKGEEFSKGFGTLMGLLEKLASLGIPGILQKRDGITDMIRSQVRTKVQENLKEKLGEKLHATVTVVDA